MSRTILKGAGGRSQSGALCPARTSRTTEVWKCSELFRELGEHSIRHIEVLSVDPTLDHGTPSPRQGLGNWSRT